MAVQEYKDGDYSYHELSNSLSNDFLSEKEFCEFIENNIDTFVSECIGFEVDTYEKEYQLSKDKRRCVRGNRRIDFFIKTKCGKNIGVECKDPTGYSELTSAVGQCLGYITLFEMNEKKLDYIYIVSTKIDFILPAIINKFNLPIGFICIDKSKFIKYLGDRK